MICPYQITVMTGELLIPVISAPVYPAPRQKGNTMAKSPYQFNKQQKELAKKKKKEEKRRRKMEKKVDKIDETEKDLHLATRSRQS